MKEEIEKIIGEPVKLEHPADLARGDWAFHAGARAPELAAKLQNVQHPMLNKVEAVGGFVNIFLAPRFFVEEINKINNEKGNYGRSDSPAGGLAGQKIIIEYTDPNPFKEFHIGHLMSNTIGEALSRLIESQGAEVKRACYQGDVGLHVARAVWGLRRLKLVELTAKVLGEAYALGATEGDEAEIKALNKKIYDRSDEEINKIYDAGREVSLKYFDEIYKKLGTEFDFKFFESEAGTFGKKLVEENLGRVFERSDGAIIFRGEKYGLHTRVFVNSAGLPTYEAKELGLAKLKFDRYPYDRSIVVTGNEVNAYFQVLLKALELIFPDLAAKTKHLSHGMLRLPSGKMSSRTGEVVTAESLLSEIRGKLGERGSDEIAVAAVKYSILRQAPGRDIIFDFEKSLSLEGASGPYLQYAAVRARSVLAKATSPEESFLGSSETIPRPLKNLPPAPVERLLYRFPAVVGRAANEFAPQLLVTYLTDLAAAWNAYYASNQIIGSPEESHRLALTAALAQVLENGLHLLGAKVPAKM